MPAAVGFYYEVPPMTLLSRVATAYSRLLFIAPLRTKAATSAVIVRTFAWRAPYALPYLPVRVVVHKKHPNSDTLVA